MSFFKSNTIKEKVLAHINKKIDEAEKEYTDGCKIIDQKAEDEKVLLEDKCVNQILGKIL